MKNRVIEIGTKLVLGLALWSFLIMVGGAFVFVVKLIFDYEIFRYIVLGLFATVVIYICGTLVYNDFFEDNR